MQTITSTPKLSLAGTSLVQITDGSGNLNTLSVESVNMNIQRISGAVLAATNALPSRLTDGTSFYDARQIRALTSADIVTAAQGTAAALTGGWPVKVTDGTNIQPTGDAAARAIFTKTTDGTNTRAVEATPTFAAVSASLIHYLIQQGLYFFGQDYVTGLGNGATRDVLFITGATATAHVRISASTLGGTYTLFESPTTTANGTAITIRNRNRPSANTASATMFFTPTVTATGTQIVVIPALANKEGAVFSADDEIIFKSNTKYLIRFNSTSGSNIDSLLLNFYEV